MDHAMIVGPALEEIQRIDTDVHFGPKYFATLLNIAVFGTDVSPSRCPQHRTTSILGDSYENLTLFSYRSDSGNFGAFWLRKYDSRHGCGYR
jgi:hypothetical protein